jgi:hypothetical protein
MDLMPEILPTSHQEPTDSTIGGIIEAQHRNFNNTPYGTDAHPYSMDDVDRSGNTPVGGNLGIEVLESKFMGVDSDTPEVAANTSTMMGKNAARKPRTEAAGNWSTLGNKHPL